MLFEVLSEADIVGPVAVGPTLPDGSTGDKSPSSSKNEEIQFGYRIKQWPSAVIIAGSWTPKALLAQEYGNWVAKTARLTIPPDVFESTFEHLSASTAEKVPTSTTSPPSSLTTVPDPPVLQTVRTILGGLERHFDSEVRGDVEPYWQFSTAAHQQVNEGGRQKKPRSKPCAIF
jgi:hypothetical protein